MQESIVEKWRQQQQQQPTKQNNSNEMELSTLRERRFWAGRFELSRIIAILDTEPNRISFTIFLKGRAAGRRPFITCYCKCPKFTYKSINRLLASLWLLYFYLFDRDTRQAFFCFFFLSILFSSSSFLCSNRELDRQTDRTKGNNKQPQVPFHRDAMQKLLSSLLLSQTTTTTETCYCGANVFCSTENNNKKITQALAVLNR